MRTLFTGLKKNNAWMIVLLLGLQLSASAQKKQVLCNDSLFKRYADFTTPVYQPATRYYIINSRNTFPKEVKVLRLLSANTAIVNIDNSQAFASLQPKGKITAAKPVWKLSPAADRMLQQHQAKPLNTIIGGSNADSLHQWLKENHKSVTVKSVNRPSNTLTISCSIDYIQKHLLHDDRITFIDIATTAHAETGVIGYDRSFHGITTIDNMIPGANGNNIVVGIKEQQPDAADIDLHNRILASPIAAPNTSYHATVIGSLIGGAGNSFYDARGIAYGCRFFPSTFANLFADDATLLAEKKVTVQNHSYGTVVQQFYGAEALSYDDLAWKQQYMIPVFSAGNQGEAAAQEGIYKNLPGYANLTGNFKMAKNIITVGAVDNSGSLAAESSSGPLYDGRIAPQLTALGPNGTSDAAAIVSGTIAVLQQVYADSNNQKTPPASLLKAVLYNTADEVYTPGIDYKTGYGLLNSYEAVKALQYKKYALGSVANNEKWTMDITIPANTESLKLTLAWTDTAAQLNNYKALVNDLDVQVTELNSGIVYLPWVLNSTANVDSLSAMPVRKRDTLNTAEQVSIHLPAAGVYRVQVAGTNIVASGVPFHVAYSTDSLNSFSFISPVHASDIALDVNSIVPIRWKTNAADSNATGNLYVSFDSNSWQLVQSNLLLNSKKFEWSANINSHMAQLKMETGFGDFLSARFDMAATTRPVVDFVCTDSFRLSWRSHVNASSYAIYTLTDSPYLQQVLTVRDSFVVINRSQFTSKVYAVLPLLSNGLPAARSIAIDIEQQGVQCFYRTLNNELQDNNQLKLLLELGIASYVDSVAFEKVSAAGNLVKTIGIQQVLTGKLVYTLVTNDVNSGVTYVRGRIRLKNGSMLYTNIIPVLTSGSRNIVFYPNPATPKTQLQYVLKQGITPGKKLQFFDMSGRLLRSLTSLPDTIELTGFSRGVIIFKLLSVNNEVLETGKLIIQ